MKRVVSLLIALVLCLSLAAPAFAEEFVPSITVKDGPEIVPIKDGEGKEAMGELLKWDEATGTYVHYMYLYEDCLLVTPVSQAKTSELIPDDAEALLLSVYDQLVSGSMSLPYEKHNANLDPSTMVIKDLFDVTWLCAEDGVFEADHEDHPAEVAPKGIVVRLIFDLDVSADANVYSMSYKNGAWNPIVSCTNNGDGTVTGVFEDFCPVAFTVGNSYTTKPAPTGDNSNIHVWIIAMSVSVVALGAVLILFRRKEVR